METDEQNLLVACLLCFPQSSTSMLADDTDGLNHLFPCRVAITNCFYALCVGTLKGPQQIWKVLIGGQQPKNGGAVSLLCSQHRLLSFEVLSLIEAEAMLQALFREQSQPGAGARACHAVVI